MFSRVSHVGTWGLCGGGVRGKGETGAVGAGERPPGVRLPRSELDCRSTQFLAQYATTTASSNSQLATHISQNLHIDN